MLPPSLPSCHKKHTLDLECWSFPWLILVLRLIDWPLDRCPCHSEQELLAPDSRPVSPQQSWAVSSASRCAQNSASSPLLLPCPLCSLWSFLSSCLSLYLSLGLTCWVTIKMILLKGVKDMTLSDQNFFIYSKHKDQVTMVLSVEASCSLCDFCSFCPGSWVSPECERGPESLCKAYPLASSLVGCFADLIVAARLSPFTFSNKLSNCHLWNVAVLGLLT